jgi:hypothetical protein
MASKIVLDFVLIGFLDNDLVLAYAHEHLVADLHPRHGEFVLVEVDVDVVVLPVLAFRPTRTKLLFPYHRVFLPEFGDRIYLSVFDRGVVPSPILCARQASTQPNEFISHSKFCN